MLAVFPYVACFFSFGMCAVDWLPFVAAAAGMQEHNVGIKCATITPDEQRMDGEPASKAEHSLANRVAKRYSRARSRARSKA